ncbi:MAG: riboflavin synthase [Candidatus Omnitrophota bacterium]|nr:riboflavin synthase [Candidatus Omnitrophota bacterium]
MFTGIIEELGVVDKTEESRDPRLFTIKAKKITADLKKGDSVSVNGACLTVVDVIKDRFAVEVIEETLKRTNLGDLRPADKVNLEAALKAGAKISGHFMTGHVDGIGTILGKKEEKGAILIEVAAEKDLLDGIVQKGSIAVDGISLTIAEIKQSSFSVYIIPHTSQVTTLGFKKTGDKVNLEIDMLGKFVRKFLGRGKPSNITEEFLRDKGFI